MSDDFNLGGGPSPLGQPPVGSSLAEDEKALKKGNTMTLVLGAGAALVVLAGVIAFLMSGDDTEPYENIGQQVNGMKTEHFDGFWTCALPGLQLEDLRSDQDLRQAIHQRATRRPAAYAQHVRENCLVHLNEHEPGLRQLIPPEDLATPIETLTNALTALRDAWSSYLDALSRVEGAYDEDAMSEPITAIARGWYDYKRAHGEVNTVIRGHLE